MKVVIRFKSERFLIVLFPLSTARLKMCFTLSLEQGDSFIRSLHLGAAFVDAVMEAVVQVV